MMVMTIASTPSLNASSRFFCMLQKYQSGGHCLLPISAGQSSLTGNDCSRNRSASSMNSHPQFAHSREALIPISDATTFSFFREYSPPAVTPGFMPTQPHFEFAGRILSYLDAGERASEKPEPLLNDSLVNYFRCFFNISAVWCNASRTAGTWLIAFSRP